MSSGASLHGIVNLDNVRQNYIVYNDLSKKMEESIFEQQYKTAARIIAEILEESREALEEPQGYCRNCQRSTCESCLHRDDRFCHSDQRHRRHLTSFHTAVPFIGDRGTGKTSAMYSVWERLRTYSSTNADAAFYLGAEFNDTKFVALDMIDAGMLKTTEDVMEIILAQMLGYLEELRSDNDFRELYRRIDKLHQDLCMVYLDDTRKREGYGLLSLQRVADSRNAVKEFQQLVKEFLQNMSIRKFGCKPCYLVVALDDVDMYQGSNWGMKNTQFALLEHIYCHLRIPGLIVLMTFNEHLLKHACNRHFEEIYFGRQLTDRPYTPTEQQDIENLTAQFMSKLFPREKRVYMPNFMLVDALDRPNLYVAPVLKGVRLVPFGEDESELNVKEFMLRLIAHKTDVFFDAAGTKKHFFEPRNLRELGALFQFVNSMEKIPEKKEDQEAVKARNRQQLMDYLKNQFALRHLDAEEYEEFSDLLTLPIWRQDRTLIDKIRQHRLTVAHMEGDFGHVEDAKEDRWRYSYGELLHNIYFSTRIPRIRGGSEYLFRKEFMHCIFGTHSVQMNEAVRSADSRQAMLKVVGSSLAGRWANRMLPRLWVSGYGERGAAGSISLPVRNFFGWQIPQAVQKSLLELDQPKKKASAGKRKKTAEKNGSEWIYAYLDALVVAGMFFTNIPAGGLGVRWDVTRDDEGKAALCLRSDSEEHICFNVLNFAINLYNALPDEQNEGYLSFIEQKLQKLGEDFVERLQKDWDTDVVVTELELNEMQSEESRRRKLLAPPDEAARAENQYEQAKNRMENAKLWVELKKLRAEEFDKTAFLKNWNSILRNVIDKYIEAIQKWTDCYGEYQWVLPVQNFDMMYNISKRLANVSYHDIPDDASAGDVFKYYINLYESMLAELQNQDKVYFGVRDGQFSTAFRKCVFYTTITAPEVTENGKPNNAHNSLIKQILVSMVTSTVQTTATRRYERQISLL